MHRDRPGLHSISGRFCQSSCSSNYLSPDTSHGLSGWLHHYSISRCKCAEWLSMTTFWRKRYFICKLNFLSLADPKSCLSVMIVFWSKLISDSSTSWELSFVNNNNLGLSNVQFSQKIHELLMFHVWWWITLFCTTFSSIKCFISSQSKLVK